MKKTFDAVKFQRKVRAQLSKEYAADPEGFMRKLRWDFDHSRSRKKPAKDSYKE